MKKLVVHFEFNGKMIPCYFKNVPYYKVGQKVKIVDDHESPEYKISEICHELSINPETREIKEAIITVKLIRT